MRRWRKSGAHELAVYLTELNDNRREPVETIAYVTNRARNTAAFLAFACDKIVMQREIKQDGRVIQEGAGWAILRATFRNTRRWKRPSATISPTSPPANIIRPSSPGACSIGTSHRRGGKRAAKKRHGNLSAKRSAKGSARRAALASVGVIKPANAKEEGKYLTLTAEQARDLRVASEVVGNFEEVCELEGVNPSDVAPPTPTGWTVWLIFSRIRGRALSSSCSASPA